MCLFYPFHHLVDIRQTSLTFWIFIAAVTPPSLLFRRNLFHNQRLTVIDKILFDVIFCIFKAVAYEIIFLIRFIS